MNAAAARVLATAASFVLACTVARPDGAVVASDGSGDYRSVQEAINAAPQSTSAALPWTIRIRPGVYRELVYVQREKRFVKLVGDPTRPATITFGLRASQLGGDGKPIGTFRTPTLWIDADDFTAEGITIANSAGNAGQALALRVDGDRVRFANCHFVGWQDTILLNRGRQYFKGCTIDGAVDFIFGAATAYFDNCQIVCVGDGYITAASTPTSAPYGFVFAHCTISSLNPETRTYLGRPWRDHASVTFIGTEMSAVVRPSGWNNWKKPEREKTARYYEYGSTGRGSDSGRVPWARGLTASQAAAITPMSVLSGNDGWNPIFK